MATATQLALDFATALTNKFAGNKDFEYASVAFAVVPGKKFDKIVQGRTPGDHNSVHAFIDRSTGELYKAAGWAKPAKHARYAGVEVLGSAVVDADPYGAYLYL